MEPARLQQLERLRMALVEASERYRVALQAEREAEHQRDLAYRDVEKLIRQEQDLLLYRDR